MSIKAFVILFVLVDIIVNENEDRPSRGDLRDKRDRAIAKNRRTYRNAVGDGIWFDEPYHDYEHDRFHHPEWDGKFVRYSGGQIYDKEQNGRWATERLSGHRRLQKWSRDYYPSWVDEKHRRWDEADRRYELRYGE